MLLPFDNEFSDREITDRTVYRSLQLPVSKVQIVEMGI